MFQKSLDFFEIDFKFVTMQRFQTEKIISDLEKKMVFITGPRQVGKTWLVRQIGDRIDNSVYLNFDDFEDRRIIEGRNWHRDTKLLILDELHKMDGWNNYLKGLFDIHGHTLKIVVTGSARIDTFRKSGDSLSGRYYLHRLLPFSLREINEQLPITKLFERGGFPEPLLSEEPVDARRWRNQYKDSLIRQEIADLGRISDIRNMELLFEILRRRAGSPVSYNGIAQDMHISPATVKSYVDILESLYIIFRVPPWSRNIARATQKSPKIYFYDSGMIVGDDGIRFENMMAVSLLKHVYGLNDYEGREMSLHYIRTKDGREVDFCVCEQDVPVGLYEVKLTEFKPDRNLKYFVEKIEVPAVQVVYDLRHEQTIEKIDIRSAPSFLRSLYL